MPTGKQSLPINKPPYANFSYKIPQALMQRAFPIGSMFTVEQLFHPADVAIRRIQVSSLKIYPWENLQAILFLDAKNAAWTKKIGSLYAGFGSSGVYRVLTRTVKFVGQDEIEKKLDHYYLPKMTKTLGEKNARVAIKSLSGGIAGLAEVSLHPLDTIKNKQQMLDPRSVLEIASQERSALLNGTEAALMKSFVTAAVGFGSYAFILNYMGNPEHPTYKQQATASIFAGVSASVVSNPFDVVKNRLQLTNGKSTQGMLQLTKTIIKEEGVTALSKGLVLKSIRTTLNFAVPLFLFNLFKQYQKNAALEKELVTLQGMKSKNK